MDAASTSEAVGFITLMQELKRKVRSWEQKVEVSNKEILTVNCASTFNVIHVKPQCSPQNT